MTAEKEERKQNQRMNIWSLQHFVEKKKRHHVFCGFTKKDGCLSFTTYLMKHSQAIGTFTLIPNSLRLVVSRLWCDLSALIEF